MITEMHKYQNKKVIGQIIVALEEVYEAKARFHIHRAKRISFTLKHTVWSMKKQSKVKVQEADVHKK